MKSRRTKIMIAALGVGAMMIATTSAVYASVAPGTTVTANLKGTSKLKFVGQISGTPITVQCTTFTDSATLTKKDKTTAKVPPPTISGCTDSLGGTDTVTTNSTNGSWELMTTSSGTTLSLVVPKAGASFSSSILPGCVITVAPSGTTSITGKYSSTTGDDTVKNSSFAVGGNAECSASSSKASGTIAFSPNPGKIPPFA
jgi:hypothetical protein